MVRRGSVRIGVVRQVGQRAARRGSVGCGGVGKAGMESCGAVRYEVVGQVAQGSV